MTTMLPKAPQPSREVFPFLDLPTELRLTIYTLTLPQKVRVRPLSLSVWEIDKEKEKDQLALLRTCHQIRNEARPLLFSNSFFRIDLYDDVYTQHFLTWIDGAGDGLVCRMKHFGISASIRSQFVRAEFRAEEAGAVLTSPKVGVRCRESLEDAVSPFQRRSFRAALNDLNREWTGCFSVADIKIIVDALMRCGFPQQRANG